MGLVGWGVEIVVASVGFHFDQVVGVEVVEQGSRSRPRPSKLLWTASCCTVGFISFSKHKQT